MVYLSLNKVQSMWCMFLFEQQGIGSSIIIYAFSPHPIWLCSSQILLRLISVFKFSKRCSNLFYNSFRGDNYIIPCLFFVLSLHMQLIRCLLILRERKVFKKNLSNYSFFIPSLIKVPVIWSPSVSLSFVVSPYYAC